MTAPGQTVGVSEFKDLLADKLQTSDRNVALYYCYGTALGSFALPLFGFLIDRLGCRFAMMLVATLFGTTCFLAGRVSNSLELLFLFTFLRMLGQGALSLVASTMVSLWFKRRLAFAYSIMSVGMGMGMMVVPYFFKPLFEDHSLIVAFQLISIAVFLLVPLAFFLIVDRPRMLGLSQDGDGVVDSADISHEDSESQDGLLHPDDFTFREAVGTGAFWIVTAAQAAWALIGTGLVFNRKEIFVALGSSEFLTDLAVPVLFAAVIVGQIVTGLFARHFKHATLFSAGSFGMATACGLILVERADLAIAGFAVFGFAQGIFIIMGQSLWADFYGRSHIGKIRGLVWMLVVLASSLGGFALTLGDDVATRFYPLWYSLLAMSVIGCGCLFIRTPIKKSV